MIYSLLFSLVDLLILLEVAIRDRTLIYLLHGVHGKIYESYRDGIHPPIFILVD